MQSVYEIEEGLTEEVCVRIVNDSVTLADGIDLRVRFEKSGEWSPSLGHMISFDL